MVAVSESIQQGAPRGFSQGVPGGILEVLLDIIQKEVSGGAPEKFVGKIPRPGFPIRITQRNPRKCS